MEMNLTAATIITHRSIAQSAGIPAFNRKVRTTAPQMAAVAYRPIPRLRTAGISAAKMSLSMPPAVAVRKPVRMQPAKLKSARKPSKVPMAVKMPRPMVSKMVRMYMCFRIWLTKIVAKVVTMTTMNK